MAFGGPGVFFLESDLNPILDPALLQLWRNDMTVQKCGLESVAVLLGVKAP